MPMHWSPGLRKFRLALIQLAVGADKAANLTRAEGMVREAAGKGAHIVSLPVSPPNRAGAIVHTDLLCSRSSYLYMFWNRQIDQGVSCIHEAMMYVCMGGRQSLTLNPFPLGFMHTNPRYYI